MQSSNTVKWDKMENKVILNSKHCYSMVLIVTVLFLETAIIISRRQIENFSHSSVHRYVALLGTAMSAVSSLHGFHHCMY